MHITYNRRRATTAAFVIIVLAAVLVPWDNGSAQNAARRPITDPELQRQMTLQRFELIPYDKLTPRQKQDWDEYMRLRPGNDPAGVAWNAFLHVPGLAPLMVQLRTHYASKELQLTPKQYEWAAIIASAHWTANHPWNSHSPAAIKEGVKPETVKSLAEGRRPINMAEDEEIVFDFLHELWDNKSISDATYDKAHAKFGKPGMIELVSIQTLYSSIAMAHAVARIQERTNELVPFPALRRPPASEPRQPPSTQQQP